MRSLLFSLTLLCLLTACDRSESIKEGPSPADTSPGSTAQQAAKTPAPRGTYLFHWQVDGEFNKPERKLYTRVYEWHEAEGKLEELGQVADTLLLGHQGGLSEVRQEAHQVKGCGACNESDPVAACAQDEGLLTDFAQDRIVFTLPGDQSRAQALLPAPSAGEAVAFHAPRLDYHGQLGPYLFVTYHLSQMPCYADGHQSFVEYAVLDARSGERVELLSKEALEEAGEQGDVKIAAIGQAEAMYEGFDGQLSLSAVQYYLSGSTPNALYFYEGTCGEPCSGMVDVTEDVTVELPSVILPDAYRDKVEAAPQALIDLLDAPNPARHAQGWSTAPMTDATQARLKTLLNR